MASYLSRRPAASLCALFLIISFVTVWFSPLAHAVGSPALEQKGQAQMIADIFDEHNRARRDNGLKPLVFSPDISLRVTQPFTNQLATRNNGTIWHNTVPNIALGGQNWAENVVGGLRGETAADLVAGWMKSAGHRANILNATYTTIAIGFTQADTGEWTFSATNFYGTPSSPGKTYATGAAWLASLDPTLTAVPPSSINVYLTPGTHNVNGRLWKTSCEAYSQTKRCRTEIWSSGWVFNNLTYAPSARVLWKGNPLGGNGVVGAKVSWVSSGRKWRTECDTAATGRNGCRSYMAATVAVRSGGSYRLVEKDVFNNMVVFG